MDSTLHGLVTVLVSSAGAPGQEGRSRIPTERELAETLGVSRNTVRERLSALEVLGFVRRTQGSGTYLDLPDSLFIRLHFEMAMRLGYIELEQLEQAREMLERASVRQAALRATSAEVADLTQCVEEMLETESIEADYEFHFLLIKAAKNPVMSLIADGLSPLLRELLQARHDLLRRDPKAFACANQSHVGIVEAVRNRDPDAAERALDEHFRTWNVSRAEAPTPLGPVVTPHD